MFSFHKKIYYWHFNIAMNIVHCTLDLSSVRIFSQVSSSFLRMKFCKILLSSVLVPAIARPPLSLSHLREEDLGVAREIYRAIKAQWRA